MFGPLFRYELTRRRGGLWAAALAGLNLLYLGTFLAALVSYPRGPGDGPRAAGRPWEFTTFRLRSPGSATDAAPSTAAEALSLRQKSGIAALTVSLGPA